MVERYIIMCGGEYQHWKKPRQMSSVMGEELVARTIRLLRENGIKDIAISTNNPIFEKYGVPILKHDNLYITKWHSILEGDWFNCFYPTDEPVCYLFGDVFFSDNAIKKIVNTDTDDIEFFGSRPPFDDRYIKDHEEPFALKVFNVEHLREAIKKTRELKKEGKFWREPIMWELWTVIKNAPLQKVKGEFPAEFTVINDYTCDIDWEEDIRKIHEKLGGDKVIIRVEVIKNFTLAEFDKIKNIKRKNTDMKGVLYTGDEFECDKDMAEYLTGKNAHGITVVKVIGVKMDEVEKKDKVVKKRNAKKKKI